MLAGLWCHDCECGAKLSATGTTHSHMKRVCRSPLAITCRKRGYIPITDQSDAGSVGIFT
eukprot:1553934-Pyramimonas_sp.AAC.1